MKNSTFERLQALRMDNVQRGYDMQEMKPRFDRIAGDVKAGYQSKIVSAFNLFQTPKALASRICGELGLNGGERILEPSAGLGRLISPLIEFSPREVVAIDESKDCIRVLYEKDFPNTTLIKGDFLTMQDLGKFDRIIMNPPFKQGRDIKHIKRAIELLADGGILISICANGPRQAAKLKPIASEWEELPAGTFKETGTGVNTALFVFRK